MNVWTFSVCYNEAKMVPWFLRHYSQWVDRMVIFDERSTDGTRELLKANPKVDLRDWPFTGLDDDKFLLMANEWYKEARKQADFVAVVDMDELLYHPNMASILRSGADIFESTGYALISKTGWPSDDGKRQIYEAVKTGVRQSNYDKKILHRPRLNVRHTHGRHSDGGWPVHDGLESGNVGIRLFHLHHVGGIDDTKSRNQRNYDRANDKRFAWSYASGHNDNPNQNGSVAWVRDAIENGKLKEVWP